MPRPIQPGTAFKGANCRRNLVGKPAATEPPSNQVFNRLRYQQNKECKLLKLKKLQILGFKSFCDRTELKFHGEGVAAIIGPNGCGKSNIADAISWVLGEQSAKTLRGSRMEDVIFAGTRDRKPTGMAEVSLTLIDPQHTRGRTRTIRPKLVLQDDMPAGRLGRSRDSCPRRRRSRRSYTEEAQPGKTEEVEVPRSKINTIAVAFPMTSRNLQSTWSRATRQPAAPAGHVVLKIRRRKFQQHFTAGEIAVTRRLFRSGESEYLLNGKLCRLRDIQELFMGTGLGPESYALIEQGRIGQILSSRPTDRRAIIEEAAGITKFKTKKRLAEARLEDAKQNLNRVNDIFDEVTRQMNSLKRQASKAERYAKLARRDARQTARRSCQQVRADRSAERPSSTCRQHARGRNAATIRSVMQEFEAEHAERTQRGYAIEAEIRENRGTAERHHAGSRSATSAQRRHNEERCNELTIRAASSQAELAQGRRA